MLVKKIELPTSENLKSGRIWGNSEISPRLILLIDLKKRFKKNIFSTYRGPDPLKGFFSESANLVPIFLVFCKAPKNAWSASLLAQEAWVSAGWQHTLLVSIPCQLMRSGSSSMPQDDVVVTRSFL